MIRLYQTPFRIKAIVGTFDTWEHLDSFVKREKGKTCPSKYCSGVSAKKNPKNSGIIAAPAQKDFKMLPSTPTHTHPHCVPQ